MKLSRKKQRSFKVDDYVTIKINKVDKTTPLHPNTTLKKTVTAQKWSQNSEKLLPECAEKNIVTIIIILVIIIINGSSSSSSCRKHMQTIVSIDLLLFCSSYICITLWQSYRKPTRVKTSKRTDQSLIYI